MKKPPDVLFYIHMEKGPGLLDLIKALLGARQYRIGLHAVRHMIEEGFDEENLVEALGGESRILEDYPHELRCLILGYFRVSEKVSQPLHVVCDYSDSNVLDIITAYIPQKPWWTTPSRRGRLI